jgi:pimeloyl-ACP methyl ester carboxylesterase
MNKTLLYDDKKIMYRLIGKGKPVMLVHGFGEDGSVWDNQIAFLQNDYQLIIPDLPGSGQSAIIKDMSMEGLAEVLHSIIHQEHIDCCIMIGHSMGGYIALAFTESYWNHLNGLGLFHSTSFADSDEKKDIRQKGIEFINQHGAFEFLRTTTPNLFSPVTKEKKATLIDKHITAGHNFLPQSLVSYYKAMMSRPDRTNILKTIHLPILFIMGKYDNAVPMADSLKQCHLPEKSYIHILQESGHMGMLEQADESNQLLAQYLKDC